MLATWFLKLASQLKLHFFACIILYHLGALMMLVSLTFHRKWMRKERYPPILSDVWVWSEEMWKFEVHVLGALMKTFKYFRRNQCSTPWVHGCMVRHNIFIFFICNRLTAIQNRALSTTSYPNPTTQAQWSWGWGGGGSISFKKQLKFSLKQVYPTGPFTGDPECEVVVRFESASLSLTILS